MDRTMVEASFDLYATPWQTFRQITFPPLLLGVGDKGVELLEAHLLGGSVGGQGGACLAELV